VCEPGLAYSGGSGSSAFRVLHQRQGGLFGGGFSVSFSGRSVGRLSIISTFAARVHYRPPPGQQVSNRQVHGVGQCKHRVYSTRIKLLLNLMIRIARR